MNIKEKLTLSILFIVMFFIGSLVYAAIPAHERAALIALYNATDGDNWYDNYGWKTPPLHTDGFAMPGTESSWNGITVENDNVLIVDLWENGLEGNIPSELGNLSKLKELSLDENFYLCGSIPRELGNLSYLESLDLNTARLSGNIPKELGNLSNLKSLLLYWNDISGTIPEELGNLRKLEGLSLFGNQISGTIPKELAQLSNLRYLCLDDNQLSGNIPKVLGNLTNLTTLNLADNQLSGTIPKELAQLSNLRYLCLDDNQLSGGIPRELARLSKLYELNLNSNELDGSIPAELGDLSNLRWLNLNDNDLSGYIPPKLGKLSKLSHLHLRSNQLSGYIPKELGNLSGLGSLDLSSNQLRGNIPKELGNLSKLDCLQLKHNKLSGTIPMELGNLSTLKMLFLNGNRLSGYIPPEVGNLTKLLWLNFGSNQLIGSIPKELGNLSELWEFDLSSNQLCGSIPIELTNLSNLFTDQTDIGYNALYTNDVAVKEFFDGKDPDWVETQTIAPTEISAIALSQSKINVSWTPIPYIGDPGGYKVYYSKKSGGPWTFSAITANKSASSYTVSGLLPGTTFYFVVKAKTGLHQNNSNIVYSEFSEETSATTLPGSVNTYTLMIQSSPDTGCYITVTPDDEYGNGNDTTNFSRTYPEGTIVNLTAPSSFMGKKFSHWTVDGLDKNSLSVQVNMIKSSTTIVYYVTAVSAKMFLNRTQFNFGASTSQVQTGAQHLLINDIGDTALNWTATPSDNWIVVNPSAGTENGSVKISVDIAGLSVGDYSGTITVSDTNAVNSPQTVTVNLKVQSTTDPPFGSFDTPLEGSTVYGSIPVTGWVLDDIQVEKVSIFRDVNNSLVFIGDAILVDGARPDIESAYPDYPNNFQAGWGYMMLTNFLPNGGNGTYIIEAMATDTEGNQVSLGSKTITCDNVNAVQPFGAIDTPVAGSTVSDKDFVNFGWALTPQPNTIPIDGSTITVWVDGVPLGHPIYNQYREDIANKFPGYNNSQGAIGYFYLDTTQYDNGVHTIAWSVTDDAGNTDGIGSRYFTIQNLNNGIIYTNSSLAFDNNRSRSNCTNAKISCIHTRPIKMIKGYDPNLNPVTVNSKDDGYFEVELKEMEPISIKSESGAIIDGFLKTGQQMRSLPLGSSIKNGKFYWLPIQGYFGCYEMMLMVRDREGEKKQLKVLVKIKPKFGKK